MGLPQQTNTPATEKPSSSETQQASVPAADVSTQNSSIGATDPSQIARGSLGGSHGSAEEAADRLYEERIEEEYAKREGGA